MYVSMMACNGSIFGSVHPNSTTVSFNFFFTSWPILLAKNHQSCFEIKDNFYSGFCLCSIRIFAKKTMGAPCML